MREQFKQTKVRDLIASGALFLTDGYRMRNVELASSGIPFVRGGDIGDGSINTTTADHIAPQFADRITNKLSQPGDVVFITKGTVGRVGFLRSNQPQVVFAPQVCCWRAVNREALESRFVFYLLKSSEFQANLDAVKTHGSMVADYVSLADQMNFLLTVPPIREQRAIASVLGALDDKIELNQRMNETLEALALGLFKSWFADTTQDGIRHQWIVSRLGNLCDRVLDRVSSPADWADRPLIDLSRMPQKSIALADWGLGEELTTSVTAFQSRDTLFGAIRPYFHKVGIAPVNGVTNISVFVIRPKRDTDWPFIAALCSLTETVEYANRVSKGTKMPVVSWPDFARMEIVVPPEIERDRFNRAVAPLYERIIANIHESRTLAALRDALLPKLLSGELRVPAAAKLTEAKI